MNVLSKIGGFLNRHRRKFVVAGVLLSGTVLLTKYAQHKLKEWQETETKEFLDRTRKQHHFESTERTCNQTILSLMNSLNDSLNKSLNTEVIVAEIRNNPDKKLELWEELKVLVFTRASSVIYITVMLSLTLRVQLNMIGGYLYKDSEGVSTDVQQKYLSLCNKLLDDGLKCLGHTIQNEFVKIVGPMELKKKLSIKDLENIFWSIQSTITTSDNNPLDNFSKYVVADPPSKDSVYSEMVIDTVDILDSDEVKTIAVHLINRGFGVLMDQLTDYFVPEPKTSSDVNDFVSPLNIQIPMAKLIPIINGLFSKKLPDILIHQFINNEKLKTLGANIYECYSN